MFFKAMFHNKCGKENKSRENPRELNMQMRQVFWPEKIRQKIGNTALEIQPLKR